MRVDVGEAPMASTFGEPVDIALAALADRKSVV
jgi:hypothetical protein